MSEFFAKSSRVLGMNARNLRYIRPNNKRSSIQLARNKLATKERLLKHGLPTAKIFSEIHDRRELFEFDWSSLPPSFVLKPNFGLGGNGILIVYGKNKNNQWIGGSNEFYTEDDLMMRVSNILDGNYSISNIPDIAYFEERLKLSEEFKHVSYKGIPDIRVIVFNSVPIMAMLRLPTKSSSGKANLHMGGIGVGIDLTTGITTYAASKHVGELTVHPDYNTSLRGLHINNWNEILRISVEAQRAVGLGYAGVDIVIDKQQGPVILEVNAHPGLEIQNANQTTLRDRLERVAGLNISSVVKGVKVCKDLFSNDTETEEDKAVIGVYESIEITDRNNKQQAMRVRIDTGLTSTTISKDLARRLGFQDALTALDSIVLPSIVSASDARQVEESFQHSIKGLHEDIVDIVAVRSGDKYTIRPKVSLSFVLGKKNISTQVAIAMDNKLSHPIIIGRRDLAGFLVNPTKTK
ncbi:MAG: sugar-transfer associated ATP-grasp domain-containing protein [bacterium]|nr:sugar-transfer associated ATP-grasp domain-containing protein [bacterium]